MKQNFIEKTEKLCKKCNVKFTEQRKIVAKIIAESDDHPDVEQVFLRSMKYDSNLNLATVYRTINLFETLGILKKHYFGDNRARYETADEINHDHLIDINSNTVVEFTNSELGRLINEIANVMGYELVNYNLEIYGIKKNSDDNETKNCDEEKKEVVN